jgi:hypothetical protein
MMWKGTKVDMVSLFQCTVTYKPIARQRTLNEKTVQLPKTRRFGERD